MKTIAMLEIAAEALEKAELKVVFTGGSTIPLYVDPIVASQFRGTEDVDCVFEVVGLVEYYKESAKLQTAGFHQSHLHTDWPICRWQGPKGLILDLMPTDKSILGFTNRWYRPALRHPQNFRLPSGRMIQIFALEYLIASKIEAFRDRGHSDFFSSTDFEDIIAIFDGCNQVVTAIQNAEAEVFTFIKEWAVQLLAERSVRDFIEGHLARGGQHRIELVLERLRTLSDELKNRATSYFQSHWKTRILSRDIEMYNREKVQIIFAFIGPDPSNAVKNRALVIPRITNKVEVAYLARECGRFFEELDSNRDQEFKDENNNQTLSSGNMNYSLQIVLYSSHIELEKEAIYREFRNQNLLVELVDESEM